MIKALPLSGSQHQGWDRFLEDRDVSKGKERRFLSDCLVELGGKLNEPWQFDEASRQFYVEAPGEPAKENSAATDSGTKAPLDENLAG